MVLVLQRDCCWDCGSFSEEMACPQTSEGLYVSLQRPVGSRDLFKGGKTGQWG